MGFSGGGSNVTKPHTHDSTIVQDGGSLAANVTQFGLSAGSILYSDGSNIQELGVGSASDALVVNGGATAPEWAAASSGAWTQEGYQTESGFVATLSVDVSDKDFYQVFYNISSEGTTSCSASVRINGVNSGYEWMTLSQYATSVSSHESTSDSQVILEPSQSAKTSYGVITIYKSDPNARETGTLFRGIAGNSKSGIGINYMATNAGWVSTTGAISSIQILYNTGNVLGSMTVMSADFA